LSHIYSVSNANSHFRSHLQKKFSIVKLRIRCNVTCIAVESDGHSGTFSSVPEENGILRQFVLRTNNVD
jgi:hypothetical protein